MANDNSNFFERLFIQSLNNYKTSRMVVDLVLENSDLLHEKQFWQFLATRLTIDTDNENIKSAISKLLSDTDYIDSDFFEILKKPEYSDLLRVALYQPLDISYQYISENLESLSKQDYLWQNLLTNPALPIELVSRYLRLSDTYLLKIVENYQLLEEDIEFILNNNKNEMIIREILYSQPNVPKKYFDQYVNDPEMKRVVGRNPHLPVDHAITLIKDDLLSSKYPSGIEKTAKGGVGF